MSPKPTSNKWADLQLVIAAVSMTSVLALWNMFAGPDRAKAAEKAVVDQTAQIPSVTPMPVVAPTMPPLGHKILFGGQAPQPQVVVQQSRGAGGGGGGGGVVTSTKSS
jgi:hypothetical protein